PPSEASIYRGGPSRCGYGGGGSPLKLKPFWDYNEDFTMYLASPLVVGDAVYGATCVLDPPGNYGAVFCLDATAGEERWYTDVFIDPGSGEERELKAFFSSPAVSADGKYLVIGQGLHHDEDCELICLDAQSGAVRWVVPTPLHIESSPAIEGEVVVAGAGAVEGDDLKPKGDPGYVFAVRLSDGEPLWKYPVNDPESSPVIRDGVAYIGSGLNGNAVVALRTAADEELAENGLDRLVWKTDTPYPAVGAVTLADDLVLIGCGNANYVFMSPDPKGAVLAFDRETGAVRWRTDVSNSVLGAIAVCDGKAVCAVLGGEIVAIDVKDGGKVLWRTLVRERSLLKAGPALTGTHVYALTHDGYLCVLDAADGSVLEEHYINSPSKPGEMGLSTSSPFVAGGKVFVGSETGGLRCFVGKEVR
ncbi:MAG: PQQ-binding-like beta-propeller repeat protein, partial [Thermoguttaceae bacterium]